MRIDLRIQHDSANIEGTARTGKKPLVRSEQVAADLISDQPDLRASRLEEIVTNVPEIRQTRIDSLRQAIADGTYIVNDDRLADAILRDLAKR